MQVARVFRAMARSDVEVVRLSYDPQAEVWMRTMSGVGMSDCYRGHEGIRTLFADIDEAFADWRWTVRGVADGGNRVAVRADFVGYGRSSGGRTTVRNRGDGREALGSWRSRPAGMVCRARWMEHRP